MEFLEIPRWYILAEIWWSILGEIIWHIVAEITWYIYVRELTQNALNRDEPLRILISANTYTAIDNILLDLEVELRGLLSEDDYALYRVQSKWRPAPPEEWQINHPTLQNLILNRSNPSSEIIGLRQRIQNQEGIIIIGCPPQQLHNLAIAPNSDSRAQPRETIREWFDVILIDEASQMDVASSTLVFSKRAINGTCVLAGDDLQLPPIQQADSPEGLEDMIGSVYRYFRFQQDIEPIALNINYRSNEVITEFTRTAGYSEELSSFSPELMLNLLSPIPETQPDNWPQQLFWTPNWADLLEPQLSAVSFVYEDTLSSQVNNFEAGAVATLIWLLRSRLANQLENERQPDGSIRQGSTTPYSTEHFWNKAVGVVTPHRAQMARVVNQLRQIFPDDPYDLIYGAVDTVERYQGQQRDVIIASFGVGDPDIIQAEDEFLYNLNRFNVLTSRARAKVIVFASNSLLQHLSNEIDILEESRLLKRYIEVYCQNPLPVNLGYIKNGQAFERPGILRRR